jgi:hypothetical protein
VSEEELQRLLQMFIEQYVLGSPGGQVPLVTANEDFIDPVADYQLAQGRQLDNLSEFAALMNDPNFAMLTQTADYAQPAIPSGEAQFVPAATQAFLEGADPNGTAIADLIANQGYSVPQALDTVFAPLANDPEAQKAMVEKYQPIAETVFTEVVGGRTAAAQPAPMSPFRQAAINAGFPDPIETYSASAGNLPYDAYVQAMTERAQKSYGDIPLTPSTSLPPYQGMAPAVEGEERNLGTGVLNLLPQLAMRQPPPGGYTKPDVKSMPWQNATPYDVQGANEFGPRPDGITNAGDDRLVGLISMMERNAPGYLKHQAGRPQPSAAPTYDGYTEDYWIDRANANQRRADQLAFQQETVLAQQGRTPYVDAHAARMQALMQRLGLG